MDTNRLIVLVIAIFIVGVLIWLYYPPGETPKTTTAPTTPPVTAPATPTPTTPTTPPTP
jgi:hypothetical protein